MGKVGEGAEDFFGRYNAELETLGSGVRIAASSVCVKTMMAIVDLDGKTIADLPRSIDPPALAAVMLLVERSFAEGVETGRELERSSN